MEFIGEQSYDIYFLINIFYGVLLALPHIIFVNLLILKNLIRFVLYIYILLFIVPIFALDEWLEGFELILVLFSVELFFLTTVIGFIFFIRFTQIIPNSKIIKPSSVKALKPSNKNNIKDSYKSVYWFSIISIPFLVYFYLISPENSGMLAFIEEREGVPRFAIYSAPSAFQLIFALYGRIIAPLAVFFAPNAKSRFFVTLLSLTVLMNSVERQTVVILSFAYIVTLFVKRTKISILDLFALIFILIGLFTVIIMQGNIVSNQIFEIIRLGTSVIYSRIFLDPLYMTHHIFFYFQDMPFTYGATNRIIGYIFGNYITGYTAIGIIPDGYLAVGMFGVVLAGIWYALILTICARIAKDGSSFIGGVYNLLLLIACISFFYSNTFSIIPLAIIGFVLIQSYLYKNFVKVKI